MQRCELAAGLSVSRAITGLWQVADMERDGAEVDPAVAAQAMDPYLDAGLNTFDMADHYGSAEVIVGHYQSTTDREIQALTKWVPQPGPTSRQDVREAVERALRRLRTDRLDLLQFHAWSYDDPSYLDCLFWLEELRDEGLIGQLGLTNFDTAHLRVVLSSGVEVVSNQVSFSLIDRRALGGMTELCQERGVKLLAYGTVAGGLLTERALGRPDRSADEQATWSKMKYRRFIETAGGWDPFQALLRCLDAVARRGGVSIAQVASRWVLEQPGVGAVIVGARLGESEHIDETRGLFDFELDDRAHREIDEALDALDSPPGDCGDEYRRPPFLTASGDLSHHVDEIPVPYDAQEISDGRSIVLSGVPWESLAGYSRAVRKGDRIQVSGTTASHGERLIGGDDPVAQTHFVIDKIEGALRSLGGSLAGVTRTRIYVPYPEDWEPVARAHGERFRAIQPANTLVVAGLIGEDFRVEIEAEAEL